MGWTKNVNLCTLLAGVSGVHIIVYPKILHQDLSNLRHSEKIITIKICQKDFRFWDDMRKFQSTP